MRLSPLLRLKSVLKSVQISLGEFESHDPEKRETNAERVVRFLAENRDKAYKAIEIVETTGVDENSIHPVLNRLEERGLVRHREPYWAIGDVEEVHSAMVFSATAEFLDDVLGPESREEWLRAPGGEEREQSGPTLRHRSTTSSAAVEGYRSTAT